MHSELERISYVVVAGSVRQLWLKRRGCKGVREFQLGQLIELYPARR